MTAVAALITIEPPAVDEGTIMAIATWITEPIRPASLHQSSLTLLLAAEDPRELKQGKAILELDGTAWHDPTGVCVPFYASGTLCTEPPG
jgi:hypothetical protein